MPKHQLTANVKLLQKAALVHQGKVLLLRRSENAFHRPGAWDLPGGNSEWPEVEQSQPGLHQADIAREVQEETGIDLVPEEFTFDKLVYFETYFDAPSQVFSIIAGWKCELPGDFDPVGIKISDEHEDFAWAATGELRKYDFGGEKGEFVRTIAQS